jgi:hypothetical protein
MRIFKERVRRGGLNIAECAAKNKGLCENMYSNLEMLAQRRLGAEYELRLNENLSTVAIAECGCCNTSGSLPARIDASHSIHITPTLGSYTKWCWQSLRMSAVCNLAARPRGAVSETAFGGTLISEMSFEVLRFEEL